MPLPHPPSQLPRPQESLNLTVWRHRLFEFLQPRCDSATAPLTLSDVMAELLDRHKRDVDAIHPKLERTMAYHTYAALRSEYAAIVEWLTAVKPALRPYLTATPATDEAVVAVIGDMWQEERASEREAMKAPLAPLSVVGEREAVVAWWNGLTSCEQKYLYFKHHSGADEEQLQALAQNE